MTDKKAPKYRRRRSYDNGGWAVEVRPRDTTDNDPWLARVCVRDTVCCGLREVHSFYFHYNLKQYPTAEIVEELLAGVAEIHAGGVFWVFVQYEEYLEVEYKEVMDYLVQKRNASVCTPFWNDNSGHSCTVLVHTIDPDMHNNTYWEDYNEDDDY